AFVLCSRSRPRAEPFLRLGQQTRLWAAGYGLLLVLTLACAAFVWRSPARRTAPAMAGASDGPLPEPAPVPTAGRRLRWVLLSFVPSRPLLGGAAHLSTPISAHPRLFGVPPVSFP